MHKQILIRQSIIYPINLEKGRRTAVMRRYRKTTRSQMADLADLPDAPRRRSSPPCVALQAAECQANPSRGVQYTLVPDEYREAKGLPANASVCTSRLCHRHVELLPPAGQPGRRQTPVSRKRLPDDTAADGHVRGPSPSHRQRPAVVNTVYELAGRTAHGRRLRAADDRRGRARRAAQRAASNERAQRVPGTRRVQDGGRGPRIPGHVHLHPGTTACCRPEQDLDQGEAAGV